MGQFSEQFQLNPEQKEGLTKQVKELAAAAADLELEAGNEKGTLIKLKNLQTKLEKIKKETDIGELKYDLETRRELAEKIGNVFHISKFDNGVALLWSNGDNGDYYINKQGERLFNKTYFDNDNTNRFVNGLALMNDSSRGVYLMDTNGENIFPDKYYEEMAFGFKNNMLWVKENGKYYFVDRDGNDLSKGERYDGLRHFSKGVAAVKIEDKWYLLDENLERISEGEDFEEVNNKIEEGQFAVKKEGKWYFISKKFTSTEDRPAYDRIKIFSEGLGLVEKSSKCFFVNEDGEEVFPGQFFDYVYSSGFSEGLASVNKEGVWFFIDKNGKRAFGNKFFDFACKFSNGLACVSDDGRKTNYYINKEGEEAFPGMRFDDESDFTNGICFVEKDGDRFKIDIHGKRIFD